MESQEKSQRLKGSGNDTKVTQKKEHLEVNQEYLGANEARRER